MVRRAAPWERAYLLKQRDTGTIPPCGEFLAIIGLNTHRRDINAIIHKVPKEPLKEQRGGGRRFFFAIPDPHRSCGTITGRYLVPRDVSTSMRSFEFRNIS